MKKYFIIFNIYVLFLIIAFTSVQSKNFFYKSIVNITNRNNNEVEVNKGIKTTYDKDKRNNEAKSDYKTKVTNEKTTDIKEAIVSEAKTDSGSIYNTELNKSTITDATAVDDVPIFKKNKLLITGEDSESIVFLILGDGFTSYEQDLFNEKAAVIKDYIMKTVPFSEYKDDFNFYSLNVVSNETGAANNPDELKDTYFQSSYNYAYNIERLLAPSNCEKAYELADYYVPDYDRIIMIVNDERYGGSGGYIPVTSINSSSYEILIHEMGHSIGNLADEYWAGSFYAIEAPNMTRETEPNKIPWSNSIGIKGIGIFPYDEDNSWYRPSQDCKMRYLGPEYQFCDVCKNALRNSLDDLIWQSHKVLK